MNEKRIVETVQKYIKKGCEAFNVSYPTPQIEFYDNHTSAGRYNINKDILYYNTAIAKSNKDEDFEEVIAHEVAHMFVNKMYNRDAVVRQHGRQFKRIMNVFGFSGDATHKLDTTQITQKKGAKRIYIVKCGCNTETLVTKVVANNTHLYKCKWCKQSPLFVGTVKKENNNVTRTTNC